MEENEKALITKDESLPFRLMDALDDQMIIQELEGRLPEILTYHFAEKGQEIWGLSKAGVDEAKGELAKQGECIRELEVEFKDNDNEAFFTVKAGRYVVSRDGKEIPLDTAFGFKRQPKKFTSGLLNSFWFEQGGIKAARNASMRLIPATIKQAVIEYAKQKGKVKEVKKEDTEQEMEGFKKESEKLASKLHDEMMTCQNIKDLQKEWNKIYKFGKKDLLLEHFQLLENLKNDLKGKLK